MLLLYCPVASTEPIFFVAGESASQGYRPDLLQDVPDQGHHMLMSLGWPVDPIERSDQSSSPEDPCNERQGGALSVSTRSRWRQDALQPPQVPQGIAGRDACGHFPDGGLRCITWNNRGFVGSVFSKQKNREFKLKFFRKLLNNNNIMCLQEVHGKDKFLQAIQVFAPRFSFYCTFIPGNENAGGSARCIDKELLPEEAIVRHFITCQGRDHIVNVQSGLKNLVIVNVHFEPELTSSLRIGLRIPTLWASSWVILISVNHKKEGLTYGTKLSPTVTRERPPCFIPFPHVLEIAQPDFTRRDSTALGVIRTLSGIDRIFNLPLVVARDFHRDSHVFENLRNRTIPSDHAAVRLVIQKPTNRSKANAFQVGCPNIPFSVLF